MPLFIIYVLEPILTMRDTSSCLCTSERRLPISVSTNDRNLKIMLNLVYKLP